MRKTSGFVFRAGAAFVLIACACGMPAAQSAIITVDDASSGSVFGACTLQDAVVSADTDQAAPGSTCAPGAGADTIVFAPGIDHIVLTIPGSLFDTSALIVTAPLTIDGGAVENSGVPVVTIERGSGPIVPDFRLIDATATLTLKGIALANGHLRLDGDVGSGAGIRFSPSDPGMALTLADSIVRDSTATGNNVCGGGIALQGGQNSTIAYTTVSGNRLSGTNASGAGVCANGTAGNVVIDHATIDSNITTGANSGGGGIYTNTYMDLEHTTVSNNQVQGAGSSGGGIHIEHRAGQNFFYLNNASQVIGNAATSDTSDGGGVFNGSVNTSHVNINLPLPYTASDASSTYLPVRISGNSAGRFGGGIHYQGGSEIALNQLLIDANTAVEGGGGIYGDGAISQSALTPTVPQLDMSIYNTTISGNHVTAADGIGGGVALAKTNASSKETLLFYSVTLSANTIAAGGLGAGLYVGTNIAVADSTLIYGNTGGFDVDTIAAPALNGLLYADYTLVGTHGSRIVPAGTHDLSCNPQLGPLADNGGGTLTHALAPGSCAIGAANSELSLSWDQRGQPFNRNYSGQDIGAFEAQAIVPINGACYVQVSPIGAAISGPPYILALNHNQMCATGPVANVVYSATGYGSDPAIAWQCLGQGGGTDASCSLHKLNLHASIVNGSHGTLTNAHVVGSDCVAAPILCYSISPGVTFGPIDGFVGMVYSMTITPDSGYVVSRISGCGGGTLAGNVFTSIPMESDQGPYHDIGVCTLIVEYANTRVNGACGADDGQTMFTPPALTCNAGVTSAPAGTGPWTWTCSGVNGGTTAQCSSAAPQYWPVGVFDGQNPTQQPPSHGHTQGGENQNFLAGVPAVLTFVPDEGYQVAGATGCGGNLAGNVYTTEPLSAPGPFDGYYCQVFVTFSQAIPPVDGACGPDDGHTISASPTQLCTTGTPSILLGNGPWTWSCGGQGSGTTAACMARYGTTATTWTVTPSAGGSGAISPAVAQTVNDGATASFTLTPDANYAIGAVGGTCGGSLSVNVYTTAAVTADCTVIATFVPAATPVDGVCGSDDGKTLASTPTNLCSAGTPSVVAGDGPWTWTCSGSNGGATASCSAAATRLQSATSLVANPNPATVGQNVTVQVLVNGLSTHAPSATALLAGAAPQATPIPTGTATVSEGANVCTATISNGSGSCALSFATAGTHVLTAVYSGDANYAGSSGTMQLLVTTGGGNGGDTTTVSAPAASWWGMGLLMLLVCAIGLRRGLRG
ncbi:MAG: choice-of-anchor Q domain-containing protein [Rudaea sp.]|uniref:choice-of-anchor Q domain-containing protein n=1 Tax=Rudaea sp. TaxID=2136325 RepID=UPI0039E45329